MPADTLRLLANPMNRDILGVLAVEPGFPRRIANLLGYAESEVSRRLRAMEAAGLLRSGWKRLENNVKVYDLARRRLEIRITSSGLVLDAGEDDGEAVSPSGPSMPIPPTPGFVGRRDVLARLDEQPVTVLEGLPGIGKTSVLARFARGQNALWVTCRGAESLTWVANQAALHLAQHGDRTLLDAVESGARGAQLAGALLEALDQDGRTAVVDDAHLAADPELRGFLNDAVARVSQGRLLLATRERWPHAPRDGVQVVRLEGLSDDDAVAFLSAKGLDITEGMRRRIRDEVGGHPLALHLLAEAATVDGGLEPLLDRRPERELTDYLLGEIDAGLTENERTALAHGALFAQTFHRQELETLCGRKLEAPLLALRRRNLVLGEEDGMRLHEVVRNFFYSRLEDKDRLHRKAAEQCLARSSVAGRLEAMHHLLQAGDRDTVLELVAEDLDLHDYGFVDSGYHRLYRDILEGFQRSEVESDRLWAQILDERGDLAYHAQDVEAALAHYRDAAALFDGDGDGTRAADVAWKQALCHQAAGETDEARALCASALGGKLDETTKDRIEQLQQELTAK